MNTFFSVLLDMLFPRRCIFCDKVLLGEDICEECAEKIQPEHLLRHMPLPDGTVILCAAPYSYDGLVRESILRFKFYGQKQYMRVFGDLLTKEIVASGIALHVDFVTSVPISKKRMRSRGYNQSELLARAVAEELGVPYGALLCKMVNNRQQHLLPKEERAQNVKNVYVPAQSAAFGAEEIEEKTILLIDDIVTTGATLLACTQVLLQNGAKSVCCAALADTA